MPDSATSEDQLNQLLSRALPLGPAGLHSPDPGAVLALACHVVMVQAGFKTILPTGEAAPNTWAPAPMWTKEFKDEWKFSYTATGKRNTLLLHCSLQRSSGRMLVHSVEVNNTANDHLLGLLLPKYVPETSTLQQASWAGVLQHQATLVSMLQQHIIEPLLHGRVKQPPHTSTGAQHGFSKGHQHGITQAVSEIQKCLGAVDMPLGNPVWFSDEQQGGLRSWWSRAVGPGGSYVIPAVVVTGLAATAVFMYMRRRRML